MAPDRRSPCRHLPRLRLAHLPTPLEPAPRLSAALGDLRLLIKREDLAGLACGGNKTRLLDYVMGDACERGVTAVVVAASAQSNKLREIAAAAARLGMHAALLIDDEPPSRAPQGNLLLSQLLGADLRYLGAPDPDRDLLVEQQAVAKELEEVGHVVAVLDRRLAYGALATAAYVDAAAELMAQLDEPPDWVFVTAGAGMTLAGLALGLKWLGCSARVVGVTISRPPELVTEDVLDHARRAASLLDLGAELGATDFQALGGHIGPGYGRLSAEGRQAIELVARDHGLILDPVYTGKTMAALIDQARRGIIRAGQTVVFIHTGGLPALFAYNETLVESPAV